MKRVFQHGTKIKVAVMTIVALVGGPVLLPYVPAITFLLETMAGQ